jgi:hypothetical protein
MEKNRNTRPSNDMIIAYANGDSISKSHRKFVREGIEKYSDCLQLFLDIFDANFSAKNSQGVSHEKQKK